MKKKTPQEDEEERKEEGGHARRARPTACSFAWMTPSRPQGGEHGGGPGPGRVGREIHGEDGTFASDVRVQPCRLPADAEVPSAFGTTEARRGLFLELDAGFVRHAGSHVESLVEAGRAARSSSCIRAICACPAR
jgi:hypothetical protein